MFGFLRGSARDRQYRQVYAGCCSFQHRTLGVSSLAFLSYEATFLYLLAVDAGVAPCPLPEQVTCCRLRRGGNAIYQVDPHYARYCSAFALLLASVKLDDDMADDRSLLARLAKWKLSPAIDQSLTHLESTRPGLQQSVEQCLAEHAVLEQASEPQPLAEYVLPTARAFGIMFASFGELMPGSNEKQVTLFQQIGAAIGSAIIAFDCAVDWRSDRARGRYNPLQSARQVELALIACQRYLAQAGWLCCESFGTHARSAHVLRHVFDRVSLRMNSLQQAPPRRSIWQKLSRPGKPQVRFGFCDCDCPIGDCPICDVDGTCCGDACCMCDCCIAPCDTGKSKKGSAGHNLVGKIGVAAGRLDPDGVVMIKGERLPARSVEGTIEDLISVEVVGQDSFGVTVKRADLSRGRGI